MSYLSHRVDRDQIKPRDHIYSWRMQFTYAHHGIYVGENKTGLLITTGSSGQVHDLFSISMWKKYYTDIGVRGDAIKAKKEDNNCEDFALYCKTGLLVPTGGSGQVWIDIGMQHDAIKVKVEDVHLYK
ncbi:hypothetical protein L1987_56174 [Smallanthus sonchifolius]|uniref:Uncharacterized protein n=1 Tax=Smallanthus sonchifolius TaxID=185202 RepID=A0ACB9EBK9_9ASTR|nr:hypothetical protein L1987_56174 [Smallanthus sonchifolius]